MLLTERTGCFSIAYLYPEDPTHVDFGWSLCLPTLAEPILEYEATWSGKLGYLAERCPSTTGSAVTGHEIDPRDAVALGPQPRASP